MSVDHTLDSLVDRKLLSAIAGTLRAVLKSAREFLNVTRDGMGTRLSNTRYRQWECSLGELRRFMVAADCLNLPHRLLRTDLDQTAYDALGTLAREVGKSPQAPTSASALPPLPREAVVARLEEILKALEEFLHVPPQGSPGHGQQREDELQPALAETPRLTANVERGTVTLDGQTFDVDSAQAVRWLKVLCDHPRDWIASPDLKRFDPDLDGARTDRLKKSLPEPVQSLIDSETGKGSRLRLA
jgi:hypothetical protein